jgi:hypothetical protein
MLSAGGLGWPYRSPCPAEGASPAFSGQSAVPASVGRAVIAAICTRSSAASTPRSSPIAHSAPAAARRAGKSSSQRTSMSGRTARASLIFPSASAARGSFTSPRARAAASALDRLLSHRALIRLSTPSGLSAMIIPLPAASGRALGARSGPRRIPASVRWRRTCSQTAKDSGSHGVLSRQACTHSRGPRRSSSLPPYAAVHSSSHRSWMTTSSTEK